jgi:hypothetical protein
MAERSRRGKQREEGLLPPRKPMASARRVSLFEREVRVRLSSAAVEILFERASILSEGQQEDGGYYGSTMITVDCARAAHLVSDSCDAAVVKRVRDLCAADERIRERARAVGVGEAERLAGTELAEPQVDVRVRASGAHLHIDVDVEAQIEMTKRARAR